MPERTPNADASFATGKIRVPKSRFFAKVEQADPEDTSIAADKSFRHRLVEVYGQLKDKGLLLGPLPEWAAQYEITEDNLQSVPRLQAALIGITAYSPSKWLLEQELTARKCDSAGAEPTWSPGADTDVYDTAAAANGGKGLQGLGLSGGGIRSATFCLGVLQAFAASGKLKDFDYVSSVSGGGYIHEWLASWVWNDPAGFAGVNRRLAPLPSPGSQARCPEQITWLRRYSSYLTPHRGLLSADTWTVATTWLRNTSLNQIVLFSFLGLCIFAIRAVAWPFDTRDMGYAIDLKTAGVWVAAIVVPVLLVTSVVLLGRALRSLQKSPAAGKAPSGARDDLGVALFIAAPGFVCCYLLALVPLYSRSSVLTIWNVLVLWALYILACLVTITFCTNGAWKRRAKDVPLAIPKIIGFLLSAVGITLLIFLLAQWTLSPSPASTAARAATMVAQPAVMHKGDTSRVALVMNALTASKHQPVSLAGSKPWEHPHNQPRLVCFAAEISTRLNGHLLPTGKILKAGCFFSSRRVRHASYASIFAIFGPVVFFFFQFVAFRLQLGLLGRCTTEGAREWLSRFGAWSAIISAVWIALGSIALFGPFLTDAFLDASNKKKVLSWLGIVGVHALTLYSGGSGKSDGKPDPNAKLGYKPLDLVGIIGAPICIVVLLLIVAGIVDSLLRKSFEESFTAFGVTLFIFLLFGWRVDINKFSMNPFYRNRLARCFVGGNNPVRTPDPFTGFDQREQSMRNSDVPLCCLLPARFGAEPVCGGAVRRTYDGPFPIFCATVNLTFGEDLAWQQRKGASFAFTPLYSGYDVGWTAETSNDAATTYNGFVPTAHYAYPDGIDVPTVAAISGAALSPNQGFSSHAPLAFLMTLFNVRLGWWLANPRRPKVWPSGQHRPTPLFAPRYLLSELFGLSSDTTNYLCLCDGGKFDNMALYELVRRRCSTIVICDAEEDVNTTFEGIGLTVAKCRTDFGVEIELDMRPLQPDPTTKLSKVHFVVGHIHYPAPPGGDPGDHRYTGTIVYLKTTLCGYEPVDILHYKREHEDFPQQSTLNQWFTETQFESYRRLGELIAEEAVTAF